MKLSERNIKKRNRSQRQICLHSDNSLKIQYDFLVHFKNSINSKTTAVLIGCFFIEQSIVWLSFRHTRREELGTNNVKAKTCLFTGQVDVQHMPFTYVTYNPDSRDNNLCDKRILAITNLQYKEKNVPYNTSWTVLTVTYVDAIKHDILTVNRNHITDNLTKDERQALRNLKKRQDIIIKPADKGSGTNRWTNRGT